MYLHIGTNGIVNSELAHSLHKKKNRILSRSYVIIFLTLPFSHTHGICMLHASVNQPLQLGQNPTLRNHLTL